MGALGITYLFKFFILLGSIAAAKAADFRFYHSSINDYTVYSLDNLPTILNSSAYNPDLKTVFYVPGFGSTPENDDVIRMIQVYIGRANICLLNWEKEAAKGVLGSLSYFVTAVENAKKVGNEFCKSLIALNNAGLDSSKMHLIGHSLGAQLSGYAARCYKKIDRILPRVTGLDPAGPGYDGISVLEQLNKLDAKLVVLLHTNPGKLGSYEATGTIDIWCNCGSATQPGCTGGISLELFSEQDSCSHARSWIYFSEGLERSVAFEARAGRNCVDWKAGQGSNFTIFIGDNIDPNARGNFYLRTDSKPSFGLGAQGSNPAS